MEKRDVAANQPTARLRAWRAGMTTCDWRSSPTTWAIRQRIARDLGRMARWLGVPDDHAPLREVLRVAEASLDRIAHHLAAGRIEPRPPLRLSAYDPMRARRASVVRLGVFPVNGNPIHWGHLLSCLRAVADHRLDVVAFVIQGTDPRKALSAVTEHHRHAMAQRVLRSLAPLVMYSDIGRGNARVGEDNIFRLLQLNRHQRIHAHYVVGSDHYRRVDAAGNPDTLPRLEGNLAARAHGFDARVHRLGVLFLERAPRPEPVATELDVAFVDTTLEMSSTDVRRGQIAFTPYEALSYMRRHAEYSQQIGLAELGQGTASHVAPLAGVAP